MLKLKRIIKPRHSDLLKGVQAAINVEEKIIKYNVIKKFSYFNDIIFWYHILISDLLFWMII